MKEAKVTLRLAGNAGQTLNRYRNALVSIPPPGGNGCHAALLGVASRGVLAGLADADIMADLRASIPAGSRCVPDKEIVEALAKARSTVTAGVGHGYASARAFRPPPRPARHLPASGEAYAARWIGRGDGAGEAEFWETSPVRLPESEPGPADLALTLHTLYAPDDWLFIGEREDRGRIGATIRTVRQWIDRTANPCTAKAIGSFIIPNSLTGESATMQGGKPSLRCDAAVAVRRFAVVEFDARPLAEQFAFWWAAVLPVAALIHSGGKSLHAWLRVDDPPEAADAVTRILFEELLTPAGADRTTRNPSRLSRTPGKWRPDKGAWQRLLYLDPSANPWGRGASR